jgi:hypothetical protein
MNEPQTVNCGITVPNVGDLVNHWGDQALNPDFVALDGYLGGVQTVALSSTNVTLSVPAGFTPTPSGGPTQSQNAVIRATGAITGNVALILTLPGYMIIENLTTGNFVLVVTTVNAGQQICIEQGSAQHIYNDGTNVRFVNLPPVGTYLDLCLSAVPTWIAACTIPPYLVCNGSTFSAATYPYLNARLGGNTLPDFRGRAPYYLNSATGRLTSGGAGIDGNTLFAAGGNNGIVAGQIPAITSSGTNSVTLNSTVSNIVLSNGLFGGNAGGAGGGISFNPSPTVQGISVTGAPTTNVTSNNTAGAGTTMQNAAPGVVSGIRLIRAA